MICVICILVHFDYAISLEYVGILELEYIISVNVSRYCVHDYGCFLFLGD